MPSLFKREIVDNAKVRVVRVDTASAAAVCHWYGSGDVGRVSHVSQRSTDALVWFGFQRGSYWVPQADLEVLLDGE